MSHKNASKHGGRLKEDYRKLEFGDAIRRSRWICTMSEGYGKSFSCPEQKKVTLVQGSEIFIM